MAEQQEKNPLAIESQKPKTKFSNVLKGKKPTTIVGIVVLALVLVGAAVIAGMKVTDEITKEKTLQNIVIGDITITPQDVQNYASELTASVPDASSAYEEDVNDIALKDLVLNAALIKEAKDKGLTLTDEQIVKSSSDVTVSDEEIAQKASEFRSQNKLQLVTAENVAYKDALKNDLLVQQSLLLVQSNFDTPYHKEVPEDKIPTLYDGVLNRLNNEIKPLMQSGASVEEIAKKVDVNFIKPNKTDSELIAMYKSQAVVAMDTIDNYAPGTQVFNDLEQTDYIVGDVGELKSTDEVLKSQLKNIGDTTEVFASKSGLHMIARLESTNGGRYSSWDDMLNSYIDQYVKYAGLDTSNYIANIQTLAVKVADKAVLSLTNPGLEKAKAQSYTCSAHTVRYRVGVWVLNSEGASLSNGSVRNIANPGVRYTPQPVGCVQNQQQGTGDGYLDRGDLALADCMTYPPGWGGFRNDQAPAGYEKRGVYVDNFGGGPASAGAYPWSPNGSGPGSPNYGPIWNVTNANATSNYTNYIWFVYEPSQERPQGNLIVSLQGYTIDNQCSIRGIATYRPPNTNGSQDQRVQWGLTGTYVFPGGGPPGTFAGANTGRTAGDNRTVTYGFSNPASVFPDGQGRRFYLWAKDPNTGATVYATRYIYPPQPFGCNPPPDYGTTAAVISANCTGFTLSGGDRNGTSRYRLWVYDIGTGNQVHYEEAPIPATGWSRSASGTNWQVFPNSNSGYRYHLEVDQVGIYGNLYGPPATADASTGACFQGNCSVSVTPTLAGKYNGVRDTDVFTVNATINDTGPRRVPAGNLAIAMRNIRTGAVTWGNNNGGYANGRTTYTFQVGPINQLTQLEFYPDYAGYFPIGPVCRVNGTSGNPGGPGTTVDVYQRFDIFPNANSLNLQPDNESPTSVGFSWGMSNSGTTVNNITANRIIDRNGTQIYSTSPSYDGIGATSQTDNTSVTTNSSVRYCGQVTISPAAGWVGPLDTASTSQIVVTTANRSAGPSCEVVGDKPYVKVYGGDVSSGVSFSTADGTCNLPPTGAGIFGYMRPAREQVNGGKSGSGGQLGVFSRGGDINGFTSASMRNANPAATALNGLTFSNSVGGYSNTDLFPLLGRTLTSGNSCMPDYYNDTQYSDGSQRKNTGAGNTLNGFGGLDANEQTVYNGDLTINTLNNFNIRHTIYVNGDAILRGNINYVDYSVTGGDLSSIPNFTLVVSGNIYIDRDVGRLDGTFIAQPRGDGSGGKIYSCASGKNTFVASPSALFSSGCDARQLRVNGTFLADTVVLNRTLNSLRDSAFKETAAASKAAEIFTFSPDVYLSPPVFRPKSTVTSGDYEYIATLPPVL